VTKTDGFDSFVSSIHANACDTVWKQCIDGIEDWFSMVDNQSFSNAATCNERRPISPFRSVVARHWSRNLEKKWSQSNVTKRSSYHCQVWYLFEDYYLLTLKLQ
jgi:hypothetical protein